MPKILRSRSETCATSIESARKVTEEANARLSAVEAKLAGLDEEIEKFRAQVEAESREDEERIKAAIEEESARIVIGSRAGDWPRQPRRPGAVCATLPPIWPSIRPPNNWFLRRRPIAP